LPAALGPISPGLLSVRLRLGVSVSSGLSLIRVRDLLGISALTRARVLPGLLALSTVLLVARRRLMLLGRRFSLPGLSFSNLWVPLVPGRRAV